MHMHTHLDYVAGKGAGDGAQARVRGVGVESGAVHVGQVGRAVAHSAGWHARDNIDVYVPTEVQA